MPNVCVWLKPDGQVEKQVDRPLEEHIAAIQSASVAWIDYSINEIEKDLEKIAATAGFTQVPIQKLLSGFLSSYEDADTELGIMMPAIIVNAFDVKVRPVVILIKGNLIMTVHEGDVNRIMKFARYSPTFIKKIKADTRPIGSPSSLNASSTRTTTVTSSTCGRSRSTGTTSAGG